MVLESTSITPVSGSQLTFAPRWRSVSTETLTSSMFGRFSITQGVSLRIEAEITATEVLPPLTRTVPSSRCPPVMSILSSAMMILLMVAGRPGLYL